MVQCYYGFKLPRLEICLREDFKKNSKKSDIVTKGMLLGDQTPYFIRGKK